MKTRLLNKEGWVLLVVCIITFFINNPVIVPDIMESRNIITAREMVYDGNWMVPTMNGDLRLEKPPLPTWITALAEIISPDNVGLQRGMAGLAAIMLTVFFYLSATRIIQNKRFALLSTLILCTCYNIILMGRTASWDIYCHAFMMGAIYYLIRALSGKSASWGHFIAAGIFMGLSFMSKGPVSFYALLLPFLLAYCYYYRPVMKGKWPAFITMIVVCLLISSWWYIFIYLFHGDAMAYVADKESSSWLNRNVRPWYYYWSFFLETGVWSLLLLSAIFLPAWSKIDRKKKEYLFPLIWMFLTVVLLSLLPEKKNRYLLPVLISASYTMGYLVLSWSERLKTSHYPKADKIIFRINAWLITVVVALLPVAAFIFVYREGYVSFPVYLSLSVIILLIAVYLANTAIKLQPVKLVYGVLALFLVAECFMLPLLKNIINNPDMKSVAGTREIQELNGIPFYHNEADPLRIELVYAANRKIRPLDVSDPDSIEAVLPCAILTHKPVAEELPSQLWEKVDTVYIGHFDDNRRPRNNRRYSDIFNYHITLLKKK